jgi:hypothetical protein
MTESGPLPNEELVVDANLVSRASLSRLDQPMARRPRCKLCGATRSKSRLYKRVCRDCTSRIEPYDYSDSNGAWRSRYKYHGKPCGICEAEIGENYDDYDSMSWEYGVKYYGKVICMGRTNLPVCATCATRFPEASEVGDAKPISTCRFCSAEYQSRNALFVHLRHDASHQQ